MTENHVQPDHLMVKVQETPNPSALKFVCNQVLKRTGKATFSHLSEGEAYPLVRTLFEVGGVKQLYFFQNTLTVTHDGSLSVDQLIERVGAVLRTRITVHDPDFDPQSEKSAPPPPDRSSLSPERREVEEILDRTIRPGLQADGGDLEVISFEDNEVRILYQGACGGCPSAMMGTLDAIQGILRNELQNAELIVTPI